MMSKIVFISFANKKYSAALRQIKNNVKPFSFNEIKIFTEDDLPIEIKHKMKVCLYHRGYGYWRWKPYLVKTVLEDLDEGDILIYSDAGNLWNASGVDKFHEYVSLLKDSSDSFLVFNQPFLEKDWTKGDVLSTLAVIDRFDLLMSLQLWAGCFFVKKTQESISVVNMWNHYVNDFDDLVTDKSSSYPNLLGFQENRHDQSVFSLLVKQSHHKLISWEEIQTIDGDWNKIVSQPILAKRVYKQKSYKNFNWLINKIQNYLIGLYLCHIKGFYFKDKISW